ncbi:hypothetical protein ACK3ZA_17125, partial [Aeromonas caviae]
RLAVQRLISSSIVMLMSVISTHYDLSRISVGHYTCRLHSIKPMTATLILETVSSSSSLEDTMQLRLTAIFPVLMSMIIPTEGLT